MFNSLNNKIRLNRCKINTTFFRIYHLPFCLQSAKRQAMAQAVSRRPFISKARFKNQTSQCMIYGRKGTGKGLSLSNSIFLCLSSHHSSILIFHSFIINISQAQQLAALSNKTPFSFFFLCVDYKDTFVCITTYCRNNMKQTNTHVHSVSTTLTLQQVADIITTVLQRIEVRKC